MPLLTLQCGCIWDQDACVTSSCGSGWSNVNPTLAGCNFSWAGTDPLETECNFPWVVTTPLDLDCDFNWRNATPLDLDCDFNWQNATPLDLDCGSRWQNATPLDINCDLQWVLAQALDFVCEAVSSSIDIDPTTTLTCQFPWLCARSIILIEQDVTFIRVSDSQEIKLLSVTIGADINSFNWSINGVCATRTDIGYIRPNNGPIETELVINGYTWRFLIEYVSDTYEYNAGGGYSFSGVSPSVELAKPYNTPQTKVWSTLTSAEQIVNDELFGTDWIWEWDIVNWNIPANVFSVSNASIMDIISTIVKAAGGFVNTKGGFPSGTPYDKILAIKYRYPVSPKNWGSADTDADIVDGILAQAVGWEPKPGYDHVYVSGQDNGVLVHVKRDGMPWTKAGPTIVDTLILDQSVARERGRNFLDEEGNNQTLYNLNLPLTDSDTANPPVLHPGDLISVQDLFETWRGQVKGVKISVVRPGITMSVEIEKHHIADTGSTSYENSITITIDNTNIDENLTNFPVLIHLSTSCGQNNFNASSFFTELSSENYRKKIKIEDDGGNECYVEIEKFDEVANEVWLWVRVPTVYFGQTTVLTLYYDVDVVDNTSYIGDTGQVAAVNVWDANYLAVYHLNESPEGGATGAIRDSTVANNATPYGTMLEEDLVNGKIYQGLAFDGSDDYLNCGGSIIPNAITLEAWCYAPSTSEQYLISNPSDVTHNYYDYCLRNDQFLFYTTSGSYSIGSRTPTPVTWEYIAGTHESGSNKFFVNGVLNDSGTASGNLDYILLGELGDTYVATWKPANNNSAIITDEVRISNIVRSEAWIKATYYTSIDDLITYSE